MFPAVDIAARLLELWRPALLAHSLKVFDNDLQVTHIGPPGPIQCRIAISGRTLNGLNGSVLCLASRSLCGRVDMLCTANCVQLRFAIGTNYPKYSVSHICLQKFFSKHLYDT